MTIAAKKTKEKQAASEIRRSQLSLRFAGVQARLERGGISPAFVRAAKPDFMGDMGFMGSMVFNAIIGGPVAGFIGAHMPVVHHHGLASHFEGAAASGIYEGLAALQDAAAERTSSRDDRSSLYPQGRRKAVIQGIKMQRGFNRLAANQNGRFSFDTQMDLAEMFRLADMLNGAGKTDVMNDAQDDDVSERVTPALAAIANKAQPRALRMAV